LLFLAERRPGGVYSTGTRGRQPRPSPLERPDRKTEAVIAKKSFRFALKCCS